MEQIRVFLGNIQKKHGSVNSGLLFLLVLRGTVRVRSSERQQTLSQRDLMVINHGEFYSLESGEPNVTVWSSMGEEYLEQGVAGRRFIPGFPAYLPVKMRPQALFMIPCDPRSFRSPCTATAAKGTMSC